MSDWKKEAVKKKDYRRGGLEPDPPKNTRKTKRQKPFTAEHWWKLGGGHWFKFGTYETFEVAEKVIRDDYRKRDRYLQKKEHLYRIVNKLTGEITLFDFGEPDGK